MYNVLYISHIASVNGAPKSMLDILTGLDKKIFHPYVLLPGHGSLEDELKLSHIEYYILDYKQSIRDNAKALTWDKYWDFYRGEAEAVNGVCLLIKKLNIDIIHTNCSTIDIGALASVIMKKPHVWHVREFVEEHFGWKFVNLVLQKMLMKRSFVVSISRAIGDMVRVRYGVKTKVLYDGMDSRGWYEPIDNNRGKERTTKLIIVGSILEEKGQKEAVEAVALLLEKGYNISLSIVGDGKKEFKDELKLIANENKIGKAIHFIPFTKNLKEIWQMHDITLVCSKCEALGRVTAESMLGGIPVIGSNSGGTLELIGENEERGYLYEKGNIKGLADRIEYVILNINEVKTKVARAQKFAMKEFDREQYTRRLERIYAQVVGRFYNEETI